MRQVSYTEGTSEKRGEDRMGRDQEGSSRKVGRQVYSIGRNLTVEKRVNPKEPKIRQGASSL